MTAICKAANQSLESLLEPIGSVFSLRIIKVILRLSCIAILEYGACSDEIFWSFFSRSKNRLRSWQMYSNQR